ncbi:hypothetical protein [Afipia clevelandensis]|uniref:Uncharacterized protein n=1 Tax=Afipia clevelandensis ATCC 49720 TaxID=883079 RepID=K8PH56_9BRAD|nr:hypothetical protein [Afipia clevelandensis]EKS37683.1 hypothetical protein HMPREF9696_01633 [Afipia clevelandensis ATCC 49720]
MRVLRVAMLIGLAMTPVSVPVYAQSMMPGFRLGEGKEYSEEEKAKIKANEEAAKAARSKIPDAKVSNDPWAAVRNEPAPKSAKTKSSAAKSPSSKQN